MTKNLKDLGKLKRELEVEIPFEEVKPSYEIAFQKIKSTKLRGFRPGKYPKGWIQKRFHEQMSIEAQDHLIPHYFNKIVKEMQLYPATQGKIEELVFDPQKPLRFRLSFEVCPELPPLDYQKLSLNKQEIEVTPAEKETMISQLLREHATLEAKPNDSFAEQGDRVTVDFKRTIGDEVTEQTNQHFELNEMILPEIQSNIVGMQVEESKSFSFPITADYMKEHAGKTITFELTLKGLEKVVLPVMDEAFFQKFENAQNEEEFQKYVETQVIENQKKIANEIYHQELTEQLLECYDDFELPETLLAERKQQFEEKFLKTKPDTTSEELASALEKEMNRYKKNLRIDYILQKISRKESLEPPQAEITERFTRIAMMYGMHPNEFLKSPVGEYAYKHMLNAVYGEMVLNFLVEYVLGKTAPLVAEKSVERKENPCL